MKKMIEFWQKNSPKSLRIGSIDDMPALVEMMAYRRKGDQLLSEWMMVQFTHTYMRYSALTDWGRVTHMCQ